MRLRIVVVLAALVACVPATAGAGEKSWWAWLEELSGPGYFGGIMAGHGVAILMSTHTLEVAQEMCDLISIILKGRIIARGTIDELRAMTGDADDQLTQVFLKLTGGSGLQEIDEIV